MPYDPYDFVLIPLQGPTDLFQNFLALFFRVALPESKKICSARSTASMLILLHLELALLHFLRQSQHQRVVLLLPLLACRQQRGLLLLRGLVLLLQGRGLLLQDGVVLLQLALLLLQALLLIFQGRLLLLQRSDLPILVRFHLLELTGADAPGRDDHHRENGNTNAKMLFHVNALLWI
jgi:hypothetical protein